MKVREFGSEYHWDVNLPFLSAVAPQLGLERAHCYRSGRDALKAVAQLQKSCCDRVLLPALCCESMVAPFVLHGIRPVFYRTNGDYTADFEDVQSKLTNHCILLYQSYFGIPPFSRQQLQLLRKEHPGVLLLEDRTQDLLRPKAAEDCLAHMTVASVRKWTALADGGLLWSDLPVQEPTETEPEFAALREDALRQKGTYHETGDPAVKDAFREKLARANDLLEASAVAAVMSPDSAQLLKQLDFEKIYALRCENVRMLSSVLEDALDEKLLDAVTREPESTLYFPILTQWQSEVQTALARQGIYCPVIWPVPKEALGVCSVAEDTAQRILGVPCDHRYTPEDMRHIGKCIIRTVQLCAKN